MSRKLPSDQRGLVSIMVTMIMILVISLIILGFAQVTQRNQRANLDNQLSTQAFYAAETGLNDAKPIIQSLTANKTTTGCGGYAYLQTKGLSSSNIIYQNGGNKTEYTCLDFTNQLSPLNLGTITDISSVAVPLTTGVTNLPYLTFSWTANNNSKSLDSTDCSTDNQLPINAGVAGKWNCAYGLLRLDLVPANTGAADAATLAANTETLYIKPSSAASNPTPVSFTSATAKGTIVQIHCTTGTCTATINLPPNNGNFYARVSAMYEPLLSVTIGAPGGALFTGAQARIDVTGKAQDVLRRIQEYISLTSSGGQVPAALQTTGAICKLITVTPTSATSTCPGVPSGCGGSTCGSDNTDFGNNCVGQPGCPETGGGTIDPKSDFNWTRYFQNHSSATAPTCRWQWGDGSPDTQQSNCVPNTGSTTKHEFPHITACKTYQVTLFMNYPSGTVPKTQPVVVPKVKPDGTRCPGSGTV